LYTWQNTKKTRRYSPK